MNTNHHKVILTGYVILLSVLWLSSGAQSSYAQTPESTPTPPTQATPIPLEQSPPGVAEITFAQLDQPTFELRSPIDQRSLAFEVPYRWAITGTDSYLEMHYDMQLEGNNEAEELADAVVNVYFNETLVTAFTPVEGSNQTLRIPIPPEAVTDSNQNRNKISFVYFSGICDNRQHRSLFVVHDHSFIHFKYDLLPLEINLADFPRPLAQNVFKPDSILIVIPDDYSDADLAAAASVAATMGQRTFGNVVLDLITASEATPERLANTSVIIIGQPKDNALLLDLYQRDRLPTTLTGSDSLIAGPSNQPLSPDDGVLQEIFSDFSSDYVYLIVTGGSDVAVTHAAQALSVLAPRYGFDGNLVIIADFQEIVSETAQSADTFSLADLGFKDTIFYGLDSHKASFNFFVPPNWRIVDKPALTLSYIHAAALQSTGSGLTVNLNNKPVGSAPIDQTNLGERQVVIELPKADFKLGTRNRLSFEATMNMELPDCVLPDLDLAWIRISGSSQLQLPHVEVEELDVVASLEDPLSLFVSRQDLSDVWFSLAENPTREELLGMIYVAAWLGNFASGPGFAPQVSRGAISDVAHLDSYHVIAFGLPTNNPVIATINEQLPQPFVPGEDNLRQQIGNVVYRLPDNFSIGLLQALPAPWSPGKKAVLVATGTTPEGVDWAIKTLTNEASYYDLKGDVAFISRERLEAFDSTNFIRGPLTAGVEAISEEEAEVALEVAPTVLAPTVAPAPKPEDPVAISQQYLPQDTSPPLIVTRLTFGLIGAGLVIAAVGGFLSWRRAKTRRQFDEKDSA